MQEIKLFEMFAGYGGASFGLEKAEIPFRIIGYSEIDNFAIECYEKNHNKNGCGFWIRDKDDVASFRCGDENKYFCSKCKIKNYGDCTKINHDELEDFDLLTAGFPCQPFSLSGKNKGELDIRGTLFNDIIRIAEVKQPKCMLLENVKGLTTKRHKATFEKILSELDRIGYWVYWDILNSKNYGIPQNRERVFFICVKKSEKNHRFYTQLRFPEEEKLKLKAEDLFEDVSLEKYKLTEKQKEQFIKRKRKIENNITNTLTASDNSKQSGRQTVFMRNGILSRATPRECFRLMGFLSDEIILDGISNSQKYKLAGNGWDINLVSKIFQNIYKRRT